jgi:hypothetical protein
MKGQGSVGPEPGADGSDDPSRLWSHRENLVGTKQQEYKSACGTIIWRIALGSRKRNALRPITRRQPRRIPKK